MPVAWLAESKVLRHFVGLQRRAGRSALYMRYLVKQGYVGKIRSVHMTVNVDAFPANFAHLARNGGSAENPEAGIRRNGTRAFLAASSYGSGQIHSLP